MTETKDQNQIRQIEKLLGETPQIVTAEILFDMCKDYFPDKNAVLDEVITIIDVTDYVDVHDLIKVIESLKT